MFLSFVRWLSIVYCAVYIYKKLMNISVHPKKDSIIDFCFSALAGLLCCVVDAYMPVCRVAGVAVFVLGYMVLQYKQPTFAAVVMTVIALGFSLLCFVMAGIFEGLIVTMVYLLSPLADETIVTEPLIRVTGAAFQILIAWLPFRIKPLRAGMPFLQKVRFDEPCLFVGAFLIVSTMLIRSESDIVYQVGAILAFGMLLFIIWHNRLIQTFLLERAQNRAKVMEAEADEAGDELLKQYHSQKRLASAIQMIVRDGDASEAGVDSVGVTLRYMARLADNQGVCFERPPLEMVRQLVEERCITEIQLATLLGDLIENALAAMRTVESKNLALTVINGGVSDTPEFWVYDSGIAFKSETIRKLGVERATTHPTDGGSGLGMLVVFDILRSCKASLIIDELPERPEYTKSVSICFDELGQIRIKTDRPEILEIWAERRDILFETYPTGDSAR